jgi:DNA-binding LytR/AlgR family response regulator
MKFASAWGPLVTAPLTPLRFTGLAGGLGLLAASYCLAHGLIGDDVINLPRTLAWAVTSTLPWICAWEGLKRLRSRPEQRQQLLLSAAILLAALGASVTAEYALAAIYPVDAASLAQITYRLLPIPLGIAVAAMLLQPKKDRPLSREVPVEQVLNVPTRDGMRPVRPRDVEYIKAAGNYVELVTSHETLLMRTTLHELCGQLRGLGFVRVHRSVLVNALHVLAVRRGPRGRRIVRVRSGAQLPVGRQFDEDAQTLAQASRSSQFGAVRPDGLEGEVPRR